MLFRAIVVRHGGISVVCFAWCCFARLWFFMVVFWLFAEFGDVSRDYFLAWWYFGCLFHLMLFRAIIMVIFRLCIEFGVVARDCGLVLWYFGCLLHLVLFRAIVVWHGRLLFFQFLGISIGY